MLLFFKSPFSVSSVSYLGFDHTATLFHIRDSPVDPVDRPIFLTNAFSFAMRIHNVSLPEEAKTMFQVGSTTLSARAEPQPRHAQKILKVVFCFFSPPPSLCHFQAQNFSSPIVIAPHESRYIFSLLFRPVRPSIHIDGNILLITNASKFHLPVRAYTGFLEVQRNKHFVSNDCQTILSTQSQKKSLWRFISFLHGQVQVNCSRNIQQSSALFIPFSSRRQ